MKAVCPRDRLVKVFATLFLNPADHDGYGARVFVQDVLGCRCPNEVLKGAEISFFVRPLGAYLEKRIAHSNESLSLTAIEQEVNRLLKLPETLKWPRNHTGRIIPPASWRDPMPGSVSKSEDCRTKLAGLRSMSKAAIDVLIEVPGRAYFFLVSWEKRKPGKHTLLLQYESGQLLYRLSGYNRCRLFTISHRDESKIIRQIDRALTWQALSDAFAKVSDRYAFTDKILALCGNMD